MRDEMKIGRIEQLTTRFDHRGMPTSNNCKVPMPPVKPPKQNRPQQIERLARGLHFGSYPIVSIWENLTEDERAYMRDKARVMLDYMDQLEVE